MASSADGSRWRWPWSSTAIGCWGLSSAAVTGGAGKKVNVEAHAASTAPRSAANARSIPQLNRVLLEYDYCLRCCCQSWLTHVAPGFGILEQPRDASTTRPAPCHYVRGRLRLDGGGDS